LDLRPYFILFSAIMFSHVSAQWTDERNCVHERTIKYLLQVKVNIDHSCLKMHRVISTNQELIQNNISGEKYGSLLNDLTLMQHKLC